MKLLLTDLPRAQTVSMRLSLVLASGVLVAAGATTGVMAIADDGPGKSGDPGRSAEAPGHTKDHGGHGYGPPPWAHGQSSDRAAKHEWKADWKALTPGERKARMKELARAHAEGMKEFAACAKQADSAKDCEKPLPPGLAKKDS